MTDYDSTAQIPLELPPDATQEEARQCLHKAAQLHWDCQFPDVEGTIHLIDVKPLGKPGDMQMILLTGFKISK